MLRVLFGATVREQEEAEKVARCRPGTFYPDTFNSDDISTFLSERHFAGYRVAELVPSRYGWSVRSASGLEDFRVLAGARTGEYVDGTWEDAERFAARWQAAAPAQRYVFVRGEASA
jgi:hypothetical protein